MENNKFEKIIFILLRVFGILLIVGSRLGDDNLFRGGDLLVFKGKTIIGNVYMISPSIIAGMIVEIILYLVFIRFVQKHISISKKSV